MHSRLEKLIKDMLVLSITSTVKPSSWIATRPARIIRGWRAGASKFPALTCVCLHTLASSRLSLHGAWPACESPVRIA